MAKQRVEFLAHPLRDPGGVVHQARHLVEQAVVGLGHASPPVRTENGGPIIPLQGAACYHYRRALPNPELAMPLFSIPFPAFDPVLVHIGPFAIRWYALAYIVGILLGWVY